MKTSELGWWCDPSGNAGTDHTGKAVRPSTYAIGWFMQTIGFELE
jgi:hypothetical protein